jgi:adenosylmethionine-8-amino-7-oxononanoate aminotransferase
MSGRTSGHKSGTRDGLDGPGSYAERDARYVWHPFTQMAEWKPLVITEGEGAYLIDESGRRYLDGVSSLWANVHGHRRPEIDQAVRAQLDRLAHSTLLGLTHPPAIDLAERLVALAPPGLAHVFYSDSGSTAVEVALKMAYQYHQLGKEAGQRQHFLALTDAYHGDTLGAVSVGGIDLFHQIFSPLLFHTKRTRPTVAALEEAFAAYGSTLCALVMEPLVQGAAGMLLLPRGLLRRARELCDQYGVLLIADEVATGFGRTGTLFACEQEGVRPDFLCLAKGLTGGYLPLAATLTTEAVYARFLAPRAARRAVFHGPTYTGNPLACAAALANLQLFDSEQTMQRLPARIATLTRLLADYFPPALAAGSRAAAGRAGHPHVRQVRQCGLMVGIELGRTGDEAYADELLVGARVCERARDYGIIVRPLGDVLVLMPPLCITDEQLGTLVSALRRAVDDVCGDLAKTAGVRAAEPLAAAVAP